METTTTPLDRGRRPGGSAPSPLDFIASSSNFEALPADATQALALPDDDDASTEDEPDSTDDELTETNGVPAELKEKIVTTPKSIHRSLASLKLATQVPALITYAQGIVKAMTGNASFPTPTPALATVTEAINELQAAETAALARTKGAVATRNEKRTALVALLQQLRGYVQSHGRRQRRERRRPSSRAPASPCARRRCARRASSTREAGRRHRLGEARRRLGGAPRVVRVGVQHRRRQDLGRRAVDAAGEDDRRRAAPGATVQFRYRPVTKTGEGDWSQPVSLLVK